MSDRRALCRAASRVLAAAAIALCSVSFGDDECKDAENWEMLRAPALSLASELARGAPARDGVRAFGAHARLLSEALESSGIATCGGEGCGIPALLEVSGCGLAAVVTLRTGSVSLSQRWDFSSGAPRPASPVEVSGA
mgnify:CR=1 FL=1